MNLRPHHLLDVVTGIGQGWAFAPHPYGHNVHLVAAAVLAEIDWTARFVIGADEICRPCRHLGVDGRCDDLLQQLQPPLSKQLYNDRLDAKLMDYLGMKPGVEMTVRRYLDLVNRHLPGIENLCAHPGEEPSKRFGGLVNGLARLGIRCPADSISREG